MSPQFLFLLLSGLLVNVSQFTSKHKPKKQIRDIRDREKKYKTNNQILFDRTQINQRQERKKDKSIDSPRLKAISSISKEYIKMRNKAKESQI